MARHLVIHLIVSNPPRMPACFDSPDEWESWLTHAHLSGMRIVRRADVGQTRSDNRANRSTHYEVLPPDQIDYCCDCTAKRRASMLQQGRCQPPPAAVPPELPNDEGPARCSLPSPEPLMA